VSARVRAGLALAATLACGLLAGVALGRTWLAPRPRAALTEESLLQALAKDVGLDADQVKAVRAVLDRHQQTVDSAWRAVRPNVHAAIMASQTEIASILRPDQRDRYARWLRRAHGGMPPGSARPPGDSLQP
jgi:hypothetical protein